VKLHVVDSSAWLEYFADGPAADQFAPIIEQPAALIVPVITLYEVFKCIAAQRDPVRDKPRRSGRGRIARTA
jgi:predicted nucleic acid-binding protein